ncbi:MAG: protein kinase [Actinobacteria bacterium]|nr:protein kinase [Actinomycetota bacterium]
MSGIREVRAALRAYEIDGVIGQGTWGVVWRGRRRDNNVAVAIKQLRSDATGDDEVRQRFEREARVLASLSDPHIVALHEFVVVEGRCFIITELLGGGDLGSRVSTHPPTTLESASVGLAMCAGLRHAHDRGVVHRDVKPQNVLLDDHNVAKIVDFGLARSLAGRTNLTAAGTLLGTPSYMAPEQILGEPATAATDVYAVGVILFELLSGRSVWAPASETADPLEVLVERVNREPLPLSVAWPHASIAVAAVVDRARARRASERFDDAAALGDALYAAALEFGDDEALRDSTFPVRASFRVTPNDAGGLGDDGSDGAPAGSPGAQTGIATNVAARRALATVLLIREPGRPPRTFELKRPTTVGRAAADLVLADPELSRPHARLGPSGDGSVGVEDLGSSNGTFLNGVRLDRPGRLGPRGWLDLGATRIVLAGQAPDGWDGTTC